MQPRKLAEAECVFAQYFTRTGELKRLQEGASILITGQITDNLINQIIEWMIDRMKQDETANYVVRRSAPARNMADAKVT